jgi:hypothetical protein
MKIRPESPLALAALRIVVPMLILAGPELRAGTSVASLDRSLRVAPEGLALFARWAPSGLRIAVAVQVVAAFSALLAIAGIRARLSLAVLTLSAGYLFALADLTGWVWHDMHLLWLSALLAVSPCDHALAIDRPADVSPDIVSTRYAWPLQCARLLLASAYFFPGVHKLARSGIAWALSDNLRNQLYLKWAEHGFVPAFRVDAYPGLLCAAALFVLLFELSTPVLFTLPRTRLAGAVAGLAFHVVAQEALRIPFMSLWGCYVVLIDFGPLARRLRRVAPTPPLVEKAPRNVPLIVTAGTLLAGTAITGVRGQTQAFPFACYPTFEWIAGTELPDLRIMAVLPDGRQVDVPHARDSNGYRTQREWGTVLSLANAGGVAGPDRETRERRLVAYFREATRAEPLRDEVAGAVRVRFARVYRSAMPDRQGEILRETPLADVTLDGATP